MQAMPAGCEPDELERALRRIPGVTRVRVVVGDRGAITEVHVLCLPGKLAKQIVRDVQSVALAEFEVQIDRRLISVVQLDLVGEGPRAPSGVLISDDVLRIRLDDVVVVRNDERCQVTVALRRGDDVTSGSAEGLAARTSVLRLVASATLGALARLEAAAARSDVEAVEVVRLGGRDLALTTVVVLDPPGEEVVTGAALVRNGGVFDAVARAVLDATSRRLPQLR